VKRRDDARMGRRLGAISTAMIRQRFSPTMRDASTKSRFLNDSVWARRTLAPHAHPVRAMTPPITRGFERFDTGK
jgi:hypothetical protein